jgi:hypothetical protein
MAEYLLAYVYFARKDPAATVKRGRKKARADADTSTCEIKDESRPPTFNLSPHRVRPVSGSGSSAGESVNRFFIPICSYYEVNRKSTNVVP